MQLTSLHFDNQTLRVLPLEHVPENQRLVEPVRQVKGACFSPVKPEPVRAPKLVVFSRSCLKLLGLGPEQVLAFFCPCKCQCMLAQYSSYTILTLVSHKLPTGRRCRLCSVLWWQQNIARLTDSCALLCWPSVWPFQRAVRRRCSNLPGRGVALFL